MLQNGEKRYIVCSCCGSSVVHDGARSKAVTGHLEYDEAVKKADELNKAEDGK